MINIALYQPDIPQNTAAIIRTCSCLGLKLEIIKPTGFILNEKKLNRIYMDYLKNCEITYHENFEKFIETKKVKDIILFTTKTNNQYYKYQFKKNDTLLFGSESKGVDQKVHNIIKNKLNIPIKKNTRSLKTTQMYFNETKSLTSIEIKEFSFLYIIINNPKFIKENLHLIENVKLFTNENKMLFKALIDQSNNFQDFDINRFNIDKNLIDRVLKYASIKNIWKKNLDNDEKIENILSEVVRDLKNHELEIRIQDLEEKFSKDLSEETFNQLKQLKKLKNLN